MKVLGYYVDRLEEKEEINSSNVFVAIYSDSEYTSYCPIGQHGHLSKEYLNDCQEITKKEYIEISKAFYTPQDYL